MNNNQLKFLGVYRDKRYFITSSFPKEKELRSLGINAPFILMVSAENIVNESFIRDKIKSLVLAGAEYVITFGKDSEKLHDIIDRLISSELQDKLSNRRKQNLMTIWEESMKEALISGELIAFPVYGDVYKHVVCILPDNEKIVNKFIDYFKKLDNLSHDEGI